MAFYHEGYPNRGDGTERDRSMGTRAATAHQAMRVFLLAGVLLSVASSALAAVAPSFQILSTPASFGSNVEAVGVSADGKVIIGKYFLSTTDPSCNTFGGCTRAFRWTAATGVQDLGLLDATEAEAHHLSADGSQVVGEASARTAYRRAFIWTPSIGMQDLGTPLFPNDPDHSVSRAYRMSATGSVIVGEAIPTQTSLSPDAFRFTTAAGFGFLTTLPNDFQSQAEGVSADGAVVVGRSYDSATLLGRAFRWKAGVAQDLGNLGGGEAFAFAASSDGSTVVGLSRTTTGFHPFRWTAAGGMQDLGDLGGNWATAVDVSADSTVVVGTATAPPPGGLSMAFRWTPTRKIEDLNNVLRGLGVNTGGWQLVFADAVSADGTVIVGMAENLTTHVDAPYRAVVPLPSGTCARLTCASLGKNCGTMSDGCGGTLTCGTCSAPLTCGGGGVVNVCGPLSPTTSCAAQGKNCGAIPDGAGGWLACGTCTAPQICGGSGTPNVCGTPPPVAKTLTFSPNPVVGGNSATGTVTLSGPAPAGGAQVTLSSSSPSQASVPPSVTVLAGATSANFTITTTVPAGDTAANLSACFGGQCVTNTLFISKPAGAVTLASLTLNPTSVTGGTSSTGTVTLSGAAPTGGASVTLLSSNTAVATVPPSVTVAQGLSGATFPVTSKPVTGSAVISASFGGVTLSVTLNVSTTPADTVAVTLAQYDTAKQQLQVQAASTSTSATLQVFVTATNALIGTLANKGGGKYEGQFSWPTNPSNITVRSSLGGSVSSAVQAK